MVNSHFKDTTTTKLNTLCHFTKFTPSITTFAAAVWSHHTTRFLPRCVIWSNKDCEDYLKHYLRYRKFTQPYKVEQIALQRKNQRRIPSNETEKSKRMENRTRKAAKHVIKNSKSHTDGNTFRAVLQPSWSKQWGKQSSRKKTAPRLSLRNRLDVPNVCTKMALTRLGSITGTLCVSTLSLQDESNWRQVGL